eukprot:350463-Chlamydomonas_euryale.AAC.1
MPLRCFRAGAGRVRGLPRVRGARCGRRDARAPGAAVCAALRGVGPAVVPCGGSAATGRRARGAGGRAGSGRRRRPRRAGRGGRVWGAGSFDCRAHCGRLGALQRGGQPWGAVWGGGKRVTCAGAGMAQKAAAARARERAAARCCLRGRQTRDVRRHERVRRVVRWQRRRVAARSFLATV